jgi:hypothetical protein
VSIEYGDKDENIYIFCMHGTAPLAMRNDDIRAHEVFQKWWFSSETHLLMDQPSNDSVASLGGPIWLSFKLFSILMKKSSGVREMNHAAIRKW